MAPTRPRSSIGGRLGALAALAAAGLSLLGGCGDHTPPDDGGPGGDPSWSVVFGDLDKAVLSSWGTGPNDVYFAGGGLATPGGQGAIILHFDGRSWHKLDASLAGVATLWWVNGRAANDVWFAGEQGVILHWDGAALTRYESGTTATLYGIYSAGDDDVWAVGGSPTDPRGEQDVLLHYTGGGTSFDKVAPPQELGITYYKVAGTGPADIYACGQDGVILHFDGSGWTRETTPVPSLLFTVAVAGGHAMAVGGFPSTVLERIDGSWQIVEAVQIGSTANGVSLLEDGSAVVVGGGGAKWRRQGAEGSWVDDTLKEPSSDLHGVFLAPDQSAFAVGGNFISIDAAVRIGVVAHYGHAVPSSPPSGP